MNLILIYLAKIAMISTMSMNMKEPMSFSMLINLILSKKVLEDHFLHIYSSAKKKGKN